MTRRRQHPPDVAAVVAAAMGAGAAGVIVWDPTTRSVEAVRFGSGASPRRRARRVAARAAQRGRAVKESGET